MSFTSCVSNVYSPFSVTWWYVKSIPGLADTRITILPATSPSGGLSQCERPNFASMVVPSPGLDLIFKVPPVASAFCLNRGIPNPTLRTVLLVKKGSVTLAAVASSMPHPLSLIVMTRESSVIFSCKSISTREAWARIEFWAISRIWSDNVCM